MAYPLLFPSAVLLSVNYFYCGRITASLNKETRHSLAALRHGSINVPSRWRNLSMTNHQMIRKTAERLFQENMGKYGFSFSPAGLYKAAFDPKGELYGNWELRMQSHRPSAHEYPDLYSGLRMHKPAQRKKRETEIIREHSRISSTGNGSSYALKIPVSVRVDEDVTDYFRKYADETGFSCQELMNLYLRQAKSQSLMPRFIEDANLGCRRKKAA